MKLSLLRLMAAILALAAPAIAERAELSGAGLEKRVDFWKKVYTQYGEDDVIIHDRVQVNLIYDVATESDESSRIAAVERALDEIRNNLDTPEDLNPAAKQIRDAIASYGLPVSASVLQELRDNVHTQLGIKERFRRGIIRSGLADLAGDSQVVDLPDPRGEVAVVLEKLRKGDNVLELVADGQTVAQHL